MKSMILPCLCLLAALARADVRVYVQDSNNVAWVRYECTSGETVRAFALAEDGTARGKFTAPGAAVGTLWGSTNLAPSDWIWLQTLPLTNGGGTFLDADATNHPLRFYRISVP